MQRLLKVVGTTDVYSGLGADIVRESIALKTQLRGKSQKVDTISGDIDRFQAIPIASMFRFGELRCLTPSKSLPL